MSHDRALDRARAHRIAKEEAHHLRMMDDRMEGYRAVEQARRHLASLSPERRAMLEGEWG
jgi:hypothetical protein